MPFGDINGRVSTTDAISKIVERVGKSRNWGELDDPVLRDDCGLDSLALVELLVTLEQEYSIEFPASALTGKSLRSIGSLAELVDSLLPEVSTIARPETEL